GGVGNVLRTVRWGGEKVWRGRGRVRRLLVFFVNVKRVVGRGQLSFGRVIHFFRVIGHFGRRLACYACPGRPISYKERTDMILGARRSACSIILRLLRDSPKRPPAAPPAGILSLWPIKKKPVGNDPFIIVNNLISPAHFSDPSRRRHFSSQNKDQVGRR